MKVMIFSYFMVVSFGLMFFLQLLYGQTSFRDKTIPINENASVLNESRTDVSINPNFTYFNETTDLPTKWSDPLHTCKKYFSCTIKFSEGWNDYVSFSLSTSNNTNNTWSSIYGEPIDVKPQGKYQIVTHMKLNKWATKSHVALEGLNNTQNRWNQISQCPFGTNGPVEWKEFSCIAKIPQSTHKVRLVLNAGWSSYPNQEATTWFDSINLLTNVPAESKGQKNNVTLS